MTRLLLQCMLLATVCAAGPAFAQSDLQDAVDHLPLRSIGPAVMGGRIADLAVVESKPQIFYVGSATGGLWKTVNHGTTWESLFDDQPTSSIGDVTIAPSNANVVWVGTGEPQNRQSSPWGNGVYKSMDGGRTWTHMGLEDTKHIARIVIHPRNPDVVYVAAVGHLWGPNADRGVFKSTDGGSTWSKILFVDDDTGAIDLAMDPGDPATLYAAMYQRRRTGWGFNGGGPGSGLYRTFDGGNAWTELTEGLPDGDKGRIGIDVYRRDGNIVYATIEADKRDPNAGFGGGQGGQGGRERKSGVFRSTDRGETWERMSTTNPRPMYYSQIRIDPNNVERVYVLGTRLAVSDDGGKTFRNDGAETIHVDHHALWIDPNDPDHLILGSDGGVSASWDGTGSWRMFDNLAIGQFYQIGLDMRDPYYVCGGLQDNDSWCGPSRTLNIHGIRNQDWYEVWGGDGFYNVIDPTDHTIVFTESQGGNLGRYDVTTGEKVYLRPIPGPRAAGDTSKQYRFNWNAPIVMSSHDPATIYHGANFLMRSRDRGRTWEEVGPDLTKQIDRKELEIMGVMGSESMMSPNDGISTYGNITTISESPLSPSVIYVGTDDGNVQVTRDGGASWDNVADRLDVPERTYVSRLFASRHVEGRVYATFDGHRNDDYAAYAFVSDDYGRKWRRITNGLPDGWSVNVIVEHHRTPELLFLGNEVGAFFTVDGGDNWTELGSNFPTVPVDDIQIHPRDNDLVLGTHGRSAWILHDVTPLENLSAVTLASTAHLFPVQPVTMWSLQGDWPFAGNIYSAANPSVGARIRYIARGNSGEEHIATGGNGASGDNGGAIQRSAARADTAATVTILSTGGDTIRTLTAPIGSGVQEIFWDLRYDEPYEAPEGQGGGFFGSPNGPRVMPGMYTAALTAGGETATTSIGVLAEPRRPIAQADRIARHEAVLSVHELAGPLHEASEAASKLNEQLSDMEDLIDANPDAPAEVREQVDSLKKDLEVLRDELGDRARDARVGSRIDGVTAVPTGDQEWQVEELWREVPGLIGRVNEMIEKRMPALNRLLDEHGIKPEVGKPIAVPKRR